VPNEVHLQAIQATIARTAAQASTVKGWCVTVTAALLGFGASSSRPLVALVALYVVVAFATLDAYYLSIERAFRKLYDQVVEGKVADWSMAATRPTATEMLRALKSPSVFVLYGSSVLAITTVTIIASA
jgi:hypothetical protein